MLHGKSTQTLSVRELEAELKAREDVPDDEPNSSASLETLYQMRQRIEREERLRLQVRFRLEGEVLIQGSHKPALPFGVRLIYFFVVGYWFGFVWAALGLLLCLSILGFRLGLAMLRRTGEAFTLW